MMGFIIVALWIFTVFLCMSEAYHERDWPRHTFKYFAWYTGCLVLAFFVYGS
jgi:hypothetical protein